MELPQRERIDMKKLKLWVSALALVLGLFACGAKVPLKPAMEAMKAGDLARAEGILNDAFAKFPEEKELWALRFVLYRHLAVHSPADKQQDYLNKSIAEYDRLASSLGLKPDYADMEASLRSKPEGARLLAQARQPLYGN
jgi:hypothetical protein